MSTLAHTPAYLSKTPPLLAWPVQDAKARFSEFLDTCLANGPQMVTRRGTQTAVLVPFEQWQRMSEQPQSVMQQVLLEGIDPKILSGEMRGYEPSTDDLFNTVMENRPQFNNRPVMDFED
jgi:antitoxin Phd